MHITISLQLGVSQLVRMEELALLQTLVAALALDLQEAYAKQVYNQIPFHHVNIGIYRVPLVLLDTKSEQCCDNEIL